MPILVRICRGCVAPRTGRRIQIFSRSMRGLIPIELLVAAAILTTAFASSVPARMDEAGPPERTVRLIFIHHSTGENWLRDDYGGLKLALSDNNYFVSDTNYGWGPDSIGDRTDIPNWLEWFRSENTDRIMDAVFNESGQNSSYTRTLADPGGENEIIVFKSCFPNSILEGNPDDPPTAGTELTVGNAKHVYNEILQYFASRPDKLFVVVTAPPVQDPSFADNARAFDQWLVNDWLTQNNYRLNNVAVFDFYNVLTGPDGHHWYQDGAIQHILSQQNTSYYPSAPEDDHPSKAGSLKATQEFVPLLNVFYHRWKNGTPAELLASTPVPTLAAVSTQVSPTESPTGPPATETQNGRRFALPCAGAILLPLGLVGLAWSLQRRKLQWREE